MVKCNELKELWCTFRAWFAGVLKRTRVERFDCWLGGTPLHVTAHANACRFMWECAVSPRDSFLGKIVNLQRQLRRSNTWLKKTTAGAKECWTGIHIRHDADSTLVRIDPMPIDEEIATEPTRWYARFLSGACLRMSGPSKARWVLKLVAKYHKKRGTSTLIDEHTRKLSRDAEAALQPMHGQAFLLRHLLQQPGWTTWPLADFAGLDMRSFRLLCKFVMGQFGFARVHAHFNMRAQLGVAAQSVVKRCCIFCALTQRQLVRDTEWHAIFACPSILRRRTFFQMQCAVLNVNWTSWNDTPTVTALCDLLMALRAMPQALVAFTSLLRHLERARKETYGTLGETTLAHFNRIPTWVAERGAHIDTLDLDDDSSFSF